MSGKKSIAIIGGGEKELSVLSQFHDLPEYTVLGIYDRNDKALALGIAEIIGIDYFSDRSFLNLFKEADYIIADKSNSELKDEIEILSSENCTVVDISDAYKIINHKVIPLTPIVNSRPDRFEEALCHLSRISNREKLLKWILDIAVENLNASSGSIMLYSESTEELYIGYATGLSDEVIKKTRQKLGDGIAGKAALLKKAVLTKDIAGGISGTLTKMDRDRIQSAVTAPILYEDKLIGVLNISTDKDEKELTENDRETVDSLANEVAPVLFKHLKIDTGEYSKIEKEIQKHLGLLLRSDKKFQEKFTILSKFISKEFGAATVSIYTATDEGDWLILGGSDNQLQQNGSYSRVHCSKGSLAKAYLNSREVVITEIKDEAMPKKGIKKEKLSFIYLPLINKEPVGVLVIEFTNLDSLEKFRKHKESLRFQLGLFINSQLKDIRDIRKMATLEKLSDLTPELINSGNISGSIDKLPSVLSQLVRASMGSFHYFEAVTERTSYYNFPSDEKKFKELKSYDSERVKKILNRPAPECISYLSTDVETFESPPFYYSIITYPIIDNNKTKAIFIGYNKETTSPLDSSIFGENDIKLLSKAKKILNSISAVNIEEKKEGIAKPENLEELLIINQNLLISKIQEEIERAKRYHQTFTVTVFKIIGLRELLESEQRKGLIHINAISSKLKDVIRKTDYFSWIEPDILAILSLESYGRIKILEKRISSFIDLYLEKTGLFDPELFHSESSFARFPGKSETPAALILEAKKGLD